MFEQYFSSQHDHGPSVLIISGTHGNESHAVAAVLMVAEFISRAAPNRISPFHTAKSFSFIHGLNEYGLINHTREDFYKKEEKEHDLNRLFKPEYETSDQIREKLISAIKSADIVIDVHNSPFCKDCFAVDYDQNAEKVLSKTSKTLLAPLLRTANVNAGTIKFEALSLGKLGFTVELNGMDSRGVDLSYSVSLLVDFISNVLSDYEVPVKKCENLENYLSFSIKSRLSGVVTWSDSDIFSKEFVSGEKICTIKSLDGKETQEIKAPFTGYIYDAASDFFIAKGESLIEFAKNPQELFR